MEQRTTTQGKTVENAADFTRRLSEERGKTAFGTPTRAITSILNEIERYINSGACKKDPSFRQKWTALYYELTQLYNKANSDLVVATNAGNETQIAMQHGFIDLIARCIDGVSKAAGIEANPSAVSTAEERPPQLGQLIAVPRVFTGMAGGALEVTLPDQFQGGIAEPDQEEARRLLQNWFNAKEYGGNVAEAGEKFYNFLKKHVGPKQLDTMLCGTETGATCTKIKQLFQKGDLDALLDGEYPISETLRRTLESASRTTRYIISNVNVFIESGFKLGEITELGAYVRGGYQTALTRTRLSGGPVTEEIAHLFEGEMGPFLQLQLGAATYLKGSAGAGYGQLEGGVFFPAELRLKSQLGTTEGTALVFDIYGRGKFGLNPEEFRQMQAGTDAYLILFQIGERQFGIFTSADVMNIRGKSGEFTFNVTNVQLNVGPQFQTSINGWLVAFQTGPVFVVPIEGPEGQTTYGLNLGTMFQKGDFRGGIMLESPNLFNPGEAPRTFTGNLMLGFTFPGPGEGRR
ncbi:MAG: hypothetical protein QXH30_00340 [Candidatus Bilamarchaeaceae archaeon]